MTEREQNDILREIVAQMSSSAHSTIIQRAFIVAQHLDLSRAIQPVDVARASGFNDTELAMLSLLLDPAFNNGKVYLAPEFVRKYLVGGDSRQLVNHFYKEVLCAKHREGIDFFLLDMQREDDARIVKLYDPAIWCEKSHQIKTTRGRTQSAFYAVSGRCFKELIMQARTDAGKQLRDYYIRLEELVPIFAQLMNFAQMIIIKQQSIIQQRENARIEHARVLAIEDARMSQMRAEEAQREREIAEHQREEAQREREIAERKFIRMRTISRATQKPTRDEWFYIATSPSLASQDHFKPGKTDNLRNRLSSYNCGRAEGDLMFFARIWKCYDVASIERIIGRALEHYADREDKEMVVIPFDVLLRVVESALDNDSRIGEIMSDFVDHFDDILSAPPSATIGAINLDEVDPKPIARRSSGKSRKKPDETKPPLAPAPPASTSFADVRADDVDIVEVIACAHDAVSVSIDAVIEPSLSCAAKHVLKVNRYRARKRAEQLGLPIPAGCEKKKSGRPPKYATDEERAAAHAAFSRKWREKQSK